MIRQTSMEAYETIRDNGLLGQRQWEVYEVVYKNGPLLANEAFRIIAQNRDQAFAYDSNTRARFTELREMGVLVEVGTKMDPVTKMNGILWDVTPALPVKSDKPERFNAERAFRDLQDKVNRLEVELSTLKYAAPRSQSGQMSLF